MPKVRTATGAELDATFSLHANPEGYRLYYESRGPNRNDGYIPGLELLLERLGEQSGLITDAVVDSRETQHLPVEDRRIHADGFAYPINPANADIRTLRLAFGRAQGQIGRAKGATGPGNATKRIRLSLEFPSEPRRDPVDMEDDLVAGTRTSGRRFWSILTRRSVYRLAEAVQELTTDVVMAKESKMSCGDRLIMWQAKTGADKRGVVAFAEVIEGPRFMNDAANPFWIDREAANSVERRVTVKYFVPPLLPLWLGEAGAECLEELTIARGQGTVFIVTPEQWERVVAAAGGWNDGPEPEPDVPPDDATAGAVEAPSKGQGRRLSVEERRAVEEFAMKRARDYFITRGIPCIDTHTRKPYDLQVQQDGKTLYVEVKGTTSAGEKVILTTNEVELLRRECPNTVLFVTSDIVLDKSQKPPVASGGRDRIIEAWRPLEETLRPLTYECTLGTEYGCDVTQDVAVQVVLAEEAETV